MAWFWPDIKHRCAHKHDIIDFAGMHNPNKRIAHDHDMKVRRRKRAGQLLDRLVRQAQNVGQTICLSKHFYALKFTSTPHKTKCDVRAICQFLSRGHDRIQGMTGAVVT